MPTARTPRTLITLGPTQEPIDEVRFLSNRSSGRMGIALALEAIERGWPVTVLMGPICPPPAPERERLAPHIRRFRTARELESLLAETWPHHDLLLMAAAVADHRPAEFVPGKLRRDATGSATLRLEPVPDLLASLADRTRPDQCAIGFALEPSAELEASAAHKLRRKRIRGIVANALETMDSADVEGVLLLDDGSSARPDPRRLEKSAFARWLLDACVPLVDAALSGRSA